MAQQYLIDIGMNDTLEDVIRKCNHNFRVSNASQTRQSSSKIRSVSGDVDDLENRVITNEENISILQDDVLDIRNELLDSMHYMGSVSQESALPHSPAVGDTYLITTGTTTRPANTVVIWDGSSWVRTNNGSSGGQGSTSDYNDLMNKPQIESVTLLGNKSFADLGLSPVTATEIWALF